MPQVRRTPTARADLLRIWRHIAQDNIEAADRLLDTIDEKCRLIATQPRMGQARPELASMVRSVPVGNYLLFYQPIPQGIEAVRVLHGARNIQQLFEDSL